ncbi:MAG: histidinol-phosphate transaminase [Bacteroidetes bacterium]|nr:histidinol-phosphate transaminase [Bacteroidota bacterium]
MEIKNLVRKNILNLKPYTSARDIYESDKGILLDANENSWGSTFTEINGLNLNRYPDPHQKDLRYLVGKYLSVGPENLFFGVGSDEIIDLLIRIFCDPGKDKAIIPEPTYGMYKVACDINNVETITVLLNDKFQLDLKEIKNHYDENVKIIFLCSPNNPTGNLLNKNDVVSLCKELNSIIIVDEAYIDFAGDGALIDEIKYLPNLIVLRTFSKAWGLAGIRLGYCIANSEVINYLFKVKAPYNINSLTRYALESSLKNSALKEKYIKGIVKERERLKNQLETSSAIIKVYESDANFLLVKCKDGKAVQAKLAEKGIIVRDRSTQPMLENCLRISVGNEEENDLLWDEIKKLV